MQTLTLFFGFAIVAIAMENCTAKFRFEKTSDAGAKGYQEIQSRTDAKRYLLRGATGTETVIIRDGNSTMKRNLTTEDQEFSAKNSKITIEFTNDECCEPDKNVLFTPGYELRISTKDNDFPTNYLEKWNCGNCSSNSQKKDLQSRRGKVDQCYKTQKEDDCTKCRLVKEGQFCYPGNYTVIFKTEKQCENVTFGGCDFPPLNFFDKMQADSEEECSEQCFGISRCNYYRYNRQNKECNLMYEKYRAEYCSIRAGPRVNKATDCLYLDNEHLCDELVEEDCKYNGNNLKKFEKGDVTSADGCQRFCEMDSRCQYWIFDKKEIRCILKKDVNRTCKFKAGKRMSPNDYDYCQAVFDNEQN